VTTSPVTPEIQATVGRSIREYCPGGGASSESKRAVVPRHFSHRPRRIFSEEGGGMQEKDGARRGLRHDGGRMRRVEGEKWRESC
jgi:hypothetical protein